MTRSERRHALRKLFKEYERLVREVMAEHEADPEKDERTFLWDPVATICAELGIARRKLSALTKELTGMAAHEVVDKVRAETIEEKLEEVLVRIFRKSMTAGKRFHHESYYANWYWDDILWDKLKRSRRAPYYDRAEWVMRMGFPNYARYRRGVMLAHRGLTPQQLEGRVIDRLAEYYVLALDVGNRQEGLDDKYWVTRIKTAGLPYTDRWAKAMNERPEWLAAMKEKLGMAKDLEEFSVMVNRPPLTPIEAETKARVDKSAAEEAAKRKALEPQMNTDEHR
jgi:AraC-like DNA-binding protein